MAEYGGIEPTAEQNRPARFDTAGKSLAPSRAKLVTGMSGSISLSVLLAQCALLLFRQIAIRHLIQGTSADDLKRTIGVVARRATTSTAMAEHLDDNDRRLVVVAGLRRQPRLLGGAISV